MEDEENDLIKNFPIWKEKYSKLGVSPRELYMRQNGLCWLKAQVGSEGEVVINCTDGEDEAVTSRMLNPTIECVQCMTCFMGKVIGDAVKDNE